MYAGYGMPRRAPTTIPLADGRRERLGGIPDGDILNDCTKCDRPIFVQSSNVTETNGRNPDGSPRLKHRRCPKVAAR